MHDSASTAPTGSEPRPPGAQPQGAGREPDGASPCNTAPSNCIPPENVTVLRQGIDSLYLSYPGRASLEVETKLIALKDLAQAENPLKQAQASLQLGSHLFRVHGKGAGYYPYILSDNAYYLKISRPWAKQIPLVYVQIASHWLTAKGVEYVAQELDTLVALLGTVEDEAQVSRADIYVDFVSQMPLNSLSVGQFVSRARRISTHTMGRRFTGYSIGLGGDISARLYDKTEEIKESGKTYLYDLWRETGWNGADIVYRLEFQFERKTLTEHEAKTVPALLAKMGPLWRYATLHWLKLTIPSLTDTTQSRWPLHPVWADLANVVWLDSQPGTSQPVRPDRAPSDYYLFANGLSGLTSYMAREGLTDPDTAADAYFDAARRFHNTQAHYTGIDFKGYVREKAALKARDYNLTYPDIQEARDEHLTEAMAKAYRKAKDGE